MVIAIAKDDVERPAEKSEAMLMLRQLQLPSHPAMLFSQGIGLANS
jgi:hypothetical protein